MVDKHITEVPYYIRELPGIVENLPSEAARFLKRRIISRDYRTPRAWKYKGDTLEEAAAERDKLDNISPMEAGRHYIIDPKEPQ